MKERYKIKIEPLTAVHIGTGEKCTPLDYKITSKIGNTDLKKNMYLKFSSDKILNRLIESKNQEKVKQFDVASVKGNMKELQSFFQENLTDFSDIDYPCEITSDFLKIYQKNREKDPLDNALEVWQIYRPEGKKTPVIPGSSIKGAIRTAVLNSILYNISDENYNDLKEKFSEEKNKKNFDSVLQKELLGKYSDAKNDPFRSIRFSDCTFPAKDSQIVVSLSNITVDKRAQSFASNEMMILAEAIKGRFMESTLSTDGLVEINSDLFSKKQTSYNITMKDIIKSCNEFFSIQFDNEYDKFYANSYDDSCNFINKLKKEIDSICKTENSFVVRLGRWSQVEFVTFGSDFRTPKTPVRKGKVIPHGTSRTVLNYNGQYLPMGWCKCTVEHID